VACHALTTDAGRYIPFNVREAATRQMEDTRRGCLTETECRAWLVRNSLAHAAGSGGVAEQHQHPNVGQTGSSGSPANPGAAPDSASDSASVASSAGIGVGASAAASGGTYSGLGWLHR